jgi:transposase
VEFTVSQTMEHFLACHEHAFTALGGVPSKIMVDNLKSAVLQRLTGAAPVFNPRYLDFARHHGFAIEACNVARGNEKAWASYYTSFVWLVVMGARWVEPRQPGLPLAMV